MITRATWTGRLFAAASLAAALALAALLVTIAQGRGPWFDEFWSIWSITPSASPTPLVERWLSDVHPVLWPLWTWAIGDLLGDGIVARRLAANGLALLAALVGAAVLWRARPANGPFLFLFLVAVIGTPAIALAFGDYRPYFAHVCAFAVALAFWVHLQQDLEDYRPGADRVVLCVGAIAVFVSLGFHYVGALIASIAIAILLLQLWLQGRRGWAMRVGAAAAAAWSFMLVSVVLQYPRWQQYLDVHWIKTTPAEAVLIELSAFLFPFYLTPGLALVACAGWRINVGVGSEVRRIVLPFLATILISGAAIFVFNLITPMLVDRYLMLWIPLLCGACAALAAPVFDVRWMAPALLAMLAVSAVRTEALLDHLTGWSDGTARVAARVRACPATRVYWMSSWRTREYRTSLAGGRGVPIFALGYARQAREAGFSVQPLPDDGRIDMTGATCPTLVWVEHASRKAFGSAQAFLDDAGIVITGLSPASPARFGQYRNARILVVPSPARRD